MIDGSLAQGVASYLVAIALCAVSVGAIASLIAGKVARFVTLAIGAIVLLIVAHLLGLYG